MSAPDTTPRKWDDEITKARQHHDWMMFEADIHRSHALRARVARALDRYGLASSDVAVEEAIDYLTHKELGQTARYYNQAGKAQFNCQQLTHAVFSYMNRKQQQRYMTNATIDHEDRDHDDAPEAGSVKASHLPDTGQLRPDEYAARNDALRAIHAMIPETERELYDIMLAVREPGTLARIHRYAARHGIGQSGVYARIERLAIAIQRHPWFAEITAHFNPQPGRA